MFEFYLSIYFWLCWVFVAAQAFLRLWRAGATLVAVHRLLFAEAPLVTEHGLSGAHSSVVAAPGL